jgi:uncharacterized protein with HEPN domain
MSKRENSFYFVDIFIAIYKIKLYTSKFQNSEELLDSMLQWDATIRELEIIGEATNMLIRLEVLTNKKYRKIVDFRNIIIHGYFGIDEDEVWSVVTQKLISFEQELKSIIKDKNIYINDAIENAKLENIKHNNIIKYLDSLLFELK